MWALPFKNIFVRKSQAFLTILITALTIFSFVIIYLIYNIADQSLALSSKRLGADIMVLPINTEVTAVSTIFAAEPSDKYFQKKYLSQLETIDGVENITTQFFTQTLSESCCSTGAEIRIIGYDSSTDFVVKPWKKNANMSDLGPDDLLVGSDIPPFLGNKIAILGKSFNIKGRLDATGTGMDQTIFMQISQARTLSAASKYMQKLWKNDPPDNLVSCAMIKVKNGYDVAKVKEAINNLESPTMAYSTSEVITDSRKQMQLINKILLFFWLVILVISFLALAGRFSALAKDRKGEIGLLRALGTHKKDVFWLISCEALLLAGIGGVIGSALGCVCSIAILPYLNHALILPVNYWHYSTIITSGGLGICLSLVIGLMCCFFPAYRSAQLDPQDAIVKGGLN